MASNLVVHKIGGSTYSLNNKSGTTLTNAVLKATFMNEDVVKCEVKSSTPLDIGIGDYIFVSTKKYTVNQLPDLDKLSTFEYLYNITFESSQYDLLKVSFILAGNTSNTEIQNVYGNNLVGNLSVFAGMIIQNMNRVYPNQWAIGDCEDIEKTITLSFGEEDNCLSVLQNLCTEFDTEFYIYENENSKILNLKKITNQLPVPNHVFEYGKNRGLYNIKRNLASIENHVTRLYAYGSTENITAGYRSDRLCMRNRNKWNSYVEDLDIQQVYGIIEKVKYFNDIYPKRIGTVTAIETGRDDGSNNGSERKFTDIYMFNLNDKWADNSSDYADWREIKNVDDTNDNHAKYISHVVGTSKYMPSEARVSFITGKLAGLGDFEVGGYDTSTRQFTINQLESNGFIFPSVDNNAFRIEIGDKYVLTGIPLPISYIRNAEIRLKDAAKEWFDKNCMPYVKYNIEIDRDYIKNYFNLNEMNFIPGIRIKVKDSDFNLNEDIRISSVTYDLINEDSFQIVLDEFALKKNRKNYSIDIATIMQQNRRLEFQSVRYSELESEIDNNNTSINALRRWESVKEKIEPKSTTIIPNVSNSTSFKYILNENAVKDSVDILFNQQESGVLCNAMFINEASKPAHFNFGGNIIGQKKFDLNPGDGISIFYIKNEGVISVVGSAVVEAPAETYYILDNQGNTVNDNQGNRLILNNT